MSRFQRAYGPSMGYGAIRTVNLDFMVDEVLGFEADGKGPHWLINVEKNGQNTLDVLGRFARFFEVSKRDIGWSGLKDRHAVTRQYFTIPEAGWDFESKGIPDFGAHVQIISALRHGRKLRRGSHKANRFKLRLRDVDVPENALETRLLQLKTQGFPNYFGPQRFGHNNANFDRGRQMLVNPKFRHSRNDKEKLYLSAVRSWLFNHLLSIRISEGNWSQPLVDDLVILNGTNSFFLSDGPSDELTRRLEEADVHISGPLWGRPMKGYTERLETRESDWLSQFRGEANRLEQLKISMTRRALRAMPQNFSWQWQDKVTLIMEFELESGVFATSLLRELVSIIDRGGNPYKNGPTGLEIVSMGA
ncbi:MAG: tRNA pseudouridine13 synthase [Parasphingorhabdus sp.]|jgi:tRNA pseudouridine13 synthase